MKLYPLLFVLFASIWLLTLGTIWSTKGPVNKIVKVVHILLAVWGLLIAFK